MKCASCGADNPEGSSACEACREALPRTCSGCAFTSPPGFKFCGQCGASFEAAPPPPPPKPEREAERRQLTVLFCDLVGSTELSERLDPEDLRDVVRDYQTASVEVIERFEGHVAQYLGDGLLVYFGYPQAHEDDARRGVMAGLGIVEAIRLLAERVNRDRGFELAVRVGVHTGPVVLGEMGAGVTRERLALGQTPNVAARLQGLAEPGAVVVSGDTRSLAEGFFGWRSLGARELKGVTRPMDVFEALHETGVVSQFELAANRGLIRLAGREEEMGRLEAGLADAKAGRGRVMAIRGEAGIGKSRLVHELRHAAEEAGMQWEALRCSTYRRNSALHPVVETIGELLAFQPQDTPPTRREKLEQGLDAIGLVRSEWMPLAAPLLSLPLGDDDAPSSASGQKRKEQVHGKLIELCLASARRRPLVLVLEDLHWIDPSSLELLGALMAKVADAPLLLLLTYREAFEHEWPDGAVDTIELSRLGPESAEAIVNGVTGGRALPPEILEQILTKTDGVPLFVEELTKMILESGLLAETEQGLELTGPLPPLAIPATLQDSLMARLDRLGDAKEVAQVGAVVGREFSHALLSHLGGRSEEELRRSLDRLVAAELVYRQGVPPAAEYQFKHALIQDAAYGSLLKSSKQRHHQAIASAFLEHFPDRARSHPELVARHYTEAGLGELAIEHWRAAGQAAMGRSADLEAIEHLRRGLRLVTESADSSGRDQLELSFQLPLGAALTNIHGYTLPEVQTAYARALEICNRAGDDSDLGWVLVGLSTYHLVLGEFDEALELALRLIGIGEQAGNPALLAAGYYHAGAMRLFHGEVEEALGFLEGAAETTPPEDHSYREHMGMDLRTVSLGLAAWARWLSGRPELALERSAEAIERARELGHAQTLAMALVFAGAELHQFCGSAPTVLSMSREVQALAGEQGFFLWDVQGYLFEVWARAELAPGGTDADGLPVPEVTRDDADGMRARIDALYAAGSYLGIPYFLGLLARVLELTDRPDEARDVLAEALALAERTGDRFWEAELLRMRGRNDQAAGDEAAAADGFRAACARAKTQGSVALGLRAAASLGRLLRDQGRSDAMRETLEEALSLHGEAGDTPEHRDVRSLLAGLPPAADGPAGPEERGAAPAADQPLA